MSNIPARGFLESVSGYTLQEQGQKSSADRPIRLGTIDPYYTVGNPRVLFDGETSVGFKTYTWLSGYVPVGGDRVYLLPVGQSYVIAGSIAPPITVPISYDIPLLNGWKPYDYDVAYYRPQVTRTASGVVSLRGLASGTTVAAGTVIGKLPEPFRPLFDQSFPALMNNSPCGIDIFADGDIVLGYNSGNGSYLTFDNVAYNNNPNETWTTLPLTNSWANANPNVPPPSYMKDSIGRVWHQGVITRSAAPANNTPVHTALPTNFRPQYEMHIPTYGASRFSYFDITASGIRWKVGSGSPAWWHLNSAMYTPTGVGSYTNLSLINGWVNNSATHTPASYWKDPDGIVHLRGLVRSGSGTIANLPAGCRPTKVILREGLSGDAASRLDINPNGNINMSLGTNVWTSLDGVSFIAEQ